MKLSHNEIEQAHKIIGQIHSTEADITVLEKMLMDSDQIPRVISFEHVAESPPIPPLNCDQPPMVMQGMFGPVLLVHSRHHQATAQTIRVQIDCTSTMKCIAIILEAKRLEHLELSHQLDQIGVQP